MLTRDGRDRSNYSCQSPTLALEPGTEVWKLALVLDGVEGGNRRFSCVTLDPSSAQYLNGRMPRT